MKSDASFFVTVKEDLPEAVQSPPEETRVVSFFVVTMLVIAGLIGIVALVLKLARKQILGDLDNISIASELSTSSSSTVTEVEVVNEKRNKK